MTGRPKKPDAERKDYMIRVMLTRKDGEAIVKAAKAEEMDVSAWVREKLLDIIRKKK